MPDDLERRLVDLEALVREQAARLDEQAATIARLTETRRSEGEAPNQALTGGPVGRRSLLLGGAAAAAAAATAVAVGTGASPAAAANGDPMVLGSASNASTTTTRVSMAANFPNATFEAITTGNGDAVKGSSTTGGYGVLGTSNNVGVGGTSPNGIGVNAVTTTGTALRANTSGGTGIWVSSDAPDRPALRVRGRQASIYLEPYPERSAPLSDLIAHGVGELLQDAQGNLWSCIASGTPGTWRKVSGPATAGALHVLDAPVRVYDSRPGTAPAAGSKTPLTGNTARALDMKVNGSGVPAGATAVAVTLLLVDATSAGGNFTMWAQGTPRPTTNNMVWGGTAGRFSSTAICRLSPTATVNVAASASTNLVVDVTGYYR